MRDNHLEFSKPESNEQKFEMFAAVRTGVGAKCKDQLADELRKQVKIKFKRRRVIANCVDYIYSADLVDICNGVVGKTRGLGI